MGHWIRAHLQEIEELLWEQRDRLLQGLSCWWTVMDSENNPAQIHLLQRERETVFLKPTNLSRKPIPPLLNWYINDLTHRSLVNDGKQNLVLTIERRLLWELIKSASKVFLAPPGDRLQQVKDIPCLPLIYDIFIVWVLFRGKRTDVYIHFCFVPSLSLQEIVILCSDLIDTQNTHTCRINMFERGSTISSLGMLGLNVGGRCPDTQV